MIPKVAIGTDTDTEEGTGTGGRDTDVTNHIRHRHQNRLKLIHPHLILRLVRRPDHQLMGSGLMTGRDICFLSVQEVRRNYLRCNRTNVERIFVFVQFMKLKLKWCRYSRPQKRQQKKLKHQTQNQFEKNEGYLTEYSYFGSKSSFCNVSYASLLHKLQMLDLPRRTTNCKTK